MTLKHLNMYCTYPNCDKSFNRKRALYYHHAKHSKKHTCINCTPQKAFCSAALLTKHLMIHSSMSIVDDSFGSSDGEVDLETSVLETHPWYNTLQSDSSQSDSDSDSSSSIVTAAKYLCNICNSEHHEAVALANPGGLSCGILNDRKANSRKVHDELTQFGIKNPLIHPEHLSVKWYGVMGHGIVTNKHICKGEFICLYHGELILRKVGLERERHLEESNATSDDYIFFLGNKLCVDATAQDGSLGRLINHSRLSPNANACGYTYMYTRYIIIRALTCIQPGSQIRYDYGERRPEILAIKPWLYKT